MRATVAFGLRWLLESGRACEGDSWLLIPADHPALTAASLRELLEAEIQQPDFRIFIPTFQEKRGHPALLPFSLLREITDLPAEEGINQLLRRHTDRTLLVPVGDPAILWDLDTEEDYQKLLMHLEGERMMK